MTLFNCKCCNKCEFTSEHSLASHHYYRKQCKTLHYCIVLTIDQTSELISPTVQSLTPLINSPPTSTQSNVQFSNNTDNEDKNSTSDIDPEVPFILNDDSDSQEST